MLSGVYNYQPVGQGLFYNGTVGFGKEASKFSFVYDCGSSSQPKYLEQAINSLNNDHLDLLIVSHFHKDHISGIPELLKKVGHVKTVVLPYLSETER